jgi:hypothetical protein
MGTEVFSVRSTTLPGAMVRDDEVIVSGRPSSPASDEPSAQTTTASVQTLWRTMYVSDPATILTVVRSGVGRWRVGSWKLGVENEGPGLPGAHRRDRGGPPLVVVAGS